MLQIIKGGGRGKDVHERRVRKNKGPSHPPLLSMFYWINLSISLSPRKRKKEGIPTSFSLSESFPILRWIGGEKKGGGSGRKKNSFSVVLHFIFIVFCTHLLYLWPDVGGGGEKKGVVATSMFHHT